MSLYMYRLSSWWFQPLWKNISQNGNLPQSSGWNFQKCLKPPPSYTYRSAPNQLSSNRDCNVPAGKIQNGRDNDTTQWINVGDFLLEHLGWLFPGWQHWPMDQYCKSSHLQGLEVSRNKFHNAGMLWFTHLRITPTQSPVESCSMVYSAKIENYMHINFKNVYACTLKKSTIHAGKYFFQSHGSCLETPARQHPSYTSIRWHARKHPDLTNGVWYANARHHNVIRDTSSHNHEKGFKMCPSKIRFPYLYTRNDKGNVPCPWLCEKWYSNNWGAFCFLIGFTSLGKYIANNNQVFQVFWRDQRT